MKSDSVDILGLRWGRDHRKTYSYASVVTGVGKVLNEVAVGKSFSSKIRVDNWECNKKKISIRLESESG